MGVFGQYCPIDDVQTKQTAPHKGDPSKQIPAPYVAGRDSTGALMIKPVKKMFIFKPTKFSIMLDFYLANFNGPLLDIPIDYLTFGVQIDGALYNYNKYMNYARDEGVSLNLRDYDMMICSNHILDYNLKNGEEPEYDKVYEMTKFIPMGIVGSRTHQFIPQETQQVKAKLSYTKNDFAFGIHLRIDNVILRKTSALFVLLRQPPMTHLIETQQIMMNMAFLNNNNMEIDGHYVPLSGQTTNTFFGGSIMYNSIYSLLFYNGVSNADSYFDNAARLYIIPDIANSDTVSAYVRSKPISAQNSITVYNMFL